MPHCIADIGDCRRKWCSCETMQMCKDRLFQKEKSQTAAFCGSTFGPAHIETSVCGNTGAIWRNSGRGEKDRQGRAPSNSLRLGVSGSRPLIFVLRSSWVARLWKCDRHFLNQLHQGRVMQTWTRCDGKHESRRARIRACMRNERCPCQILSVYDRLSQVFLTKARHNSPPGTPDI
jgi:hypothetical protein